MTVEKAGSGSVEPDDFNALVDAVNEGGGGAGVGVLLEANFDAHDVGSISPKWTAAWDNPVDFNALPALPDGIGITTLLDGSNGAMTTTESGIWAVTAGAGMPQDATWTGFVVVDLFVYFASQLGRPVTADTSPMSGASATYCLPSGKTLANPALITLDTATADPFSAQFYLYVVRIS